MKPSRLFSLLAGAALMLAGARIAVAQNTNSNSNSDTRANFNSFQVIERNNIFDPSRRPPRQNNNGPRPPTTYYFTLKGTISYENKEYAFFDGNGANYNRALTPPETINGYKIAEVTNNTVKLAASSNQFITLRPGMQMRRVGTGPWQLVPSSDPSARSGFSDSGASSSDDSSGGAASATPVSSGGGASEDIIKRLMKKRAEENGDTTTNSTNSNGDQNQ